MFGIENLSAVPEMLSRIYSERVQKGKLTKGRKVIRGPIGLFVVREDGASGSKLAKEIVGSFGYWDARTEHFFDGVFLGWGYDMPNIHFLHSAFLQCVKDLEHELDWKYNGGAQLLLTDLVYDVASQKGYLDFSQVIFLDISGLLHAKKLRQLSNLIEELCAPSRDKDKSGNVGVWEVSDYIALLRTREFFWKYLVKKIGFVLGWADQVGPYAVRDLRRDKSKPA
jgi:hypothetical protein